MVLSAHRANSLLPCGKSRGVLAECIPTAVVSDQQMLHSALAVSAGGLEHHGNRHAYRGRDVPSNLPSDANQVLNERCRSSLQGCGLAGARLRKGRQNRRDSMTSFEFKVYQLGKLKSKSPRVE